MAPLAMTSGPSGPTRSEDAGARLVRYGGTDALPIGTLLVADYTNVSTLAGGTSPNGQTHPETVYIRASASTAAVRLNPKALFCITTSALPAASKGKRVRVCFQGYCQYLSTNALDADFAPLGLDSTNGKMDTAVSGQIILGMNQGVAVLADVLTTIYFDGEGQACFKT